ncbi:MAG: extracellular solute-binding protein [Rhodocyclaceae bacterium]|nr:extracellular solute-binding protein [Rhodocyclaceae bacterium]MDZ4215611.1 extracellular solute-binding protein [Rhodocyclaceae bacterium]
MRDRTFLNCAVLAAASLFLLTACERAPQQPAAPAPRTAVTFLHYFTGSLSGGIEAMAQAFNAQTPQYELKAVSLDHEAFKTSIQDTLKAGNPPDLYSYWAGARTASLVDYLEPIDDIWQQANFDARFPPAVSKAASEYGGKKYFVPLTQHYVAFFYNKPLFEKHGLKTPVNWDEFLSVCATLKAEGVTPIALGARDKWPAQFWFDLLLLRTAPHQFRQDLLDGKARFDDPQVLAVFARWKQLLDKGYFNRQPHPNDLAWDSGANEMVFKGEAAMTLMGTWNIGYYTNETHQWQSGKDFDFFPFPMIDPQLPVVALGPIDGLIMPKRSANRQCAREAMIHLAGIEAQQAFSKGSGALAPNLQVPATAYSDIQLRVRQEIERSPTFAFNFDLSTPPAVAEVGLNAFSEFLAFPAAYPQILKKLADDAETLTTTEKSRH